MQTQTAQPNPELFILQKMQAHEITDANSRIYCDGHFFPVSLQSVPAGDYEQPIYRLTEVEPANGTIQQRQKEQTA